MELLAFISVFKGLAIAIGAGAATVVIAQTIAASTDNKISKEEHHLITVVMLVARVAILLLFIAQSLYTALFFGGESHTALGTILSENGNTLTWFVLGVLFGNFVFIDYRVISRKIGAAVQIASWYSLVLVWSWPLSLPIQVDAFIFTYLLFVATSVLIVAKSPLFKVRTQAIPSSEA